MYFALHYQPDYFSGCLVAIYGSTVHAVV